MKKYRILSIMLFAGLLFSFACTKEGANGPTSTSEIKGSVTYKTGDGVSHPTVNPIIHIAYNATAATTTYNDNEVGNADGTYSIKGLGIGDYYVTAEYTDTHGLHYTCAGAKVHLGNSTDAVTADFILQ